MFFNTFLYHSGNKSLLEEVDQDAILDREFNKKINSRKFQG